MNTYMHSVWGRMHENPYTNLLYKKHIHVLVKHTWKNIFFYWIEGYMVILRVRRLHISYLNYQVMRLACTEYHSMIEILSYLCVFCVYFLKKLNKSSTNSFSEQAHVLTLIEAYACDIYITWFWPLEQNINIICSLNKASKNWITKTSFNSS